jgi:hypothetical protein
MTQRVEKKLVAFGAGESFSRFWGLFEVKNRKK